jgi:integrase/recombinase XerD
MKRLALFSRSVQRRMAANHLGIILDEFARDLEDAGYLRRNIQKALRIAEHFGRWLGRGRVRPQQITPDVVDRFVRLHLPRCCCPEPAPATPQRCRAALNRLCELLQRRGLLPQWPKPLTPLDRLIGRFDHYLFRVCGLSDASRRVYRRFSREFLLWRFGRSSPRLDQIDRRDLLRFVESRAKTLRPRSLNLLTTSLRSFLRFLQTEGRVKPSLIAAVPCLPAWERSAAPQTLSAKQLADLLRNFDRSTPLGRRDFAMTLCMTELGLRLSEVAQLSLEDLDWRKGTLRLVKSKAGRERLLPLPSRLGRALASYLQRGRPPVPQKRVFLCHHFPRGTPLSTAQIRYAIQKAYVRAHIPATRVHLLRHTFATNLHQQGASLKALADLLGHKSLESTTIYTRVNLKQLRLVALPWPRSAS